MRLRKLYEAENKTAIVAFGRLNPPTIGHQKLVSTIKSQSGDHYLFLSQTQKAKTDPLDFDTKIAFAKSFFPDINIGHSEVRTPIQMLQYLQTQGYTDIVYVAGSDRVESFDKLFNQYNGVPDKSGVIPYKFKSINVISAGERDPDADGAEGMSASKMRAAALNNDFDSFKQGVPKQDLADKLFKSVQGAMGVDPVEERELSKGEEKEKERIVKGMKKAKGDFKDRYGKDADAVMYATATKLAKEGETRDTHCSDKCCGADVKAEDCGCKPSCPHCNCNKKDLDEAYDPKHGHDSFSHVVKHKDDNDEKYWAVYNQDGKIVKTFYSEKSASEYAEKNHDALMNNKIKANEYGVGIVTKQNATKDVPVGGEYMNVKKLGLNKKPKKKRKETEVLTTPDEVLDELIGFKKPQKVVQQQKPKIDVLNNIAQRTDNKPFPLSYNAGKGEISVGGKVYVGPSAAKKFVSFFDRNEDKQQAMLKALKSASTTAKLFDVLGLPYKLDMER